MIEELFDVRAKFLCALKDTKKQEECETSVVVRTTWQISVASSVF